jgi:hypothetical protein
MLIAMMSSLLVLVKLKEPYLNRMRRGREGGLDAIAGTALDDRCAAV